MRRPAAILVLALAAVGAACASSGGGESRASGYVEATEVRVAAQAGGRLVEVLFDEGGRVSAGDLLARLDTADTELALRRARAERDHAAAQLRLVRAGARGEEIRQAQAQAASARAEAVAADADLAAARRDLDRFEALLAVAAGSRKQRDDAAARTEVAEARAAAARERARAADEGVARLRAGARRDEIAAAEARVSVADAQIAALEKALADALVTAPVAGTVTARLVDAGETVPRGAPVAVLADLGRVWANVYVDGPLVPRLTLGEPVTLTTDGGQRIAGTITYISPRAEFTPRNVQTADERSKLVYRVKVTAENREGVLKPGMPVEAVWPAPR
ncbi:MAG TPA: HlyD family efflux transporter periplasmic adaptor subunit [Vicinamibacterales bacterium]|nr:HlyD family efflux transporter periplasmic adaptor subunit [Vicinamibacterales bacterium]